MPVYHPYFGDLVCLMHLDGDLVDYSPLLQGFNNSGCSFVGGGGLFNSGIDIGGASNYAKSSAARLEYDLNAGDFTMEAWVKPAVVATAGVLPALSLLKPSGGAGMSLGVDISGSAVRARFDYEFGAGIQAITSIGAGVTLNNGTVYHLAATRSGDFYRLFVNGVLMSTGQDSTRGTVTARRLTIGNHDLLSAGFQGVIYEVSVCRRALWTASFTPPDGPYANFWPAACSAWPGGTA